MKWLLVTIISVLVPLHHSLSSCGCKHMRECYTKMLEALVEPGETECVENVSVGSATMIVYFKALEKYCSEFVEVKSSKLSFEGRKLLEVEIKSSNFDKGNPNVIVIDAGQDAGIETVRMALYLIQQLVACEENSDMINNIRWVILPCTNPDGMEYNRVEREFWKKNLRFIDNMSYGVDVTRNFDDAWTTCPTIDNIFSQDYPGPNSGSENETQFISDVFEKYRKDYTIQAYVSFRRDGHGLFYPFASEPNNAPSDGIDKMKKIAAKVAKKVNHKPGSIQYFANNSIFNANGKAHCGHSIDYAYNKLRIPYTFEMRMFLESDNKIISQFQALPKGYQSSMRSNYLNGIKELVNSIIAEIEKPSSK